ncbi:MAG: ankyrin repeat domain-containing protein [Alphaproteobacteria bacterium]|nr:ankyrin repeat domain-containing protein [Alphaproteobacteria bacterium]
MTDNKYNEVANKKMFEVLRDKNMDSETKAKAIGFCIDCGADVNAYEKDERFSSPILHSASFCGYREVVEVLLEKGADINAKSYYGICPDMTALHMAVLGGQREMSELLIEKGVNVDERNESETTALAYAVEKGNKEIAELLVEAGADVNAKANFDKVTILHKAVEGGNKEIVELLLEKGADINAKALIYFKGEKGGTPLDWAVISDQKEIVEILENKEKQLKAKEDIKKKIDAIREGKAKEEHPEENEFIKMEKGEMYRLDIDRLPEVSLCGRYNVNLADYKKDLLALQNGEMLTLGRKDEEPVEKDKGEKLICFEDPSNYASRKHLSIVNFNGFLYMQDRSTNGTEMREVSKAEEPKRFIKPMDKEM